MILMLLLPMLLLIPRFSRVSERVSSSTTRELAVSGRLLGGDVCIDFSDIERRTDRQTDRRADINSV